MPPFFIHASYFTSHDDYPRSDPYSSGREGNHAPRTSDDHYLSTVVQHLTTSTVKHVTMICMIAFLSLYGSVTFGGLLYLENKYERSQTTRIRIGARKDAMERILDMVNFINAVVATILSSIVLFTMDSDKRIDMRGRTHSRLGKWTVESVCAYLIIEMTLLSISSFRLPKSSWDWVKECYKETVMFHIIAFIGLTSVLLTGVGYSVAMWVIWSELTSIFLGVQTFLEIFKLRRTNIYYAVEICGAVAFVFQRVLIFLYLLWQCLIQFTTELLFIVQFIILAAGTVLNIVLALSLYY